MFERVLLNGNGDLLAAGQPREYIAAFEVDLVSPPLPLSANVIRNRIDHGTRRGCGLWHDG